MDDLRARAGNLEEDESRIKKELEALAIERQWLITQARKATITSTDLEYQLSAVTMQEVCLKRDLASLEQVVDTNLLDNWESKFNEYLTDLQVAMDELKKAAPQTIEERHRVFLLKKRIVDTLLAEARIDRNREIHVTIRVNLLKIVEPDSDSEDSGAAVQTRSGGIYTRIQ